MYIHELVKALEEKARSCGLKVGYVSRKPGHIILAVENSKRVLVWFRHETVKRSSIDLFNKIVRKIEYDAVVIVKKYKQIEGVRLPNNWIVLDVSDIDSVEKAINMVMNVISDIMGR